MCHDGELVPALESQPGVMGVGQKENGKIIVPVFASSGYLGAFHFSMTSMMHVPSIIILVSTSESYDVM